jgi:hypothetical protein
VRRSNTTRQNIGPNDQPVRQLDFQTERPSWRPYLPAQISLGRQQPSSAVAAARQLFLVSRPVARMEKAWMSKIQIIHRPLLHVYRHRTPIEMVCY